MKINTQSTKVRYVLATCALISVPLFVFNSFNSIGKDFTATSTISSEVWVELMDSARRNDYFDKGRENQKSAVKGYFSRRSVIVNFCESGTFDYSSSPIDRAYASGGSYDQIHAENDNFYKKNQLVTAKCNLNLFGSIFSNLMYLFGPFVVGYIILWLYAWSNKKKISEI